MIYKNPILKSDYSDPDVIRVGQNYYMVSSSFTYLPGIPILQSTDLVSWHTIGYAAEKLPFSRYSQPAHKCGTWAPSLRYRPSTGLFYVYVCLPDEGLFAFTAKDPVGPWATHYVKDVCGWIDPCPLFDVPNSTTCNYLIHGFAASRCGINNVLYLHQLSDDGLSVLDKGRCVYDGAQHGDTTVEGPKIYQRGKFFYIFCPAGGVEQGYQLALRASSVYGPYERQVVLYQGDTSINGPHQGGWVDTGHGEDFFIHFQDVGPYGRVTHLQPLRWVDDWPLVGTAALGVNAPSSHSVTSGFNGPTVPIDANSSVASSDSVNGQIPCGEPVLSAHGPASMPDSSSACISHPLMSDDFKGQISLQWQWQANPNPLWFQKTPQGLRLFAVPSDSLFHAGQFLSQLMQYWNFDMDVCLTLSSMGADGASSSAVSSCQVSECALSDCQVGDRAGMGMMGYNYHYLSLENGGITLYEGYASEISRWEREQVTETKLAEIPWNSNSALMRMSVRQGRVSFFYAPAYGSSVGTPDFKPIGSSYEMTCGGWVSARPGIFCMNTQGTWGGSALFSFCHVTDKDAPAESDYPKK